MNERVKKFWDSMSISTVDDNPSAISPKIRATLVIRSEAPLPRFYENTRRPEFLIEDVKKGLLRHIYGDQRTEMAEIVDRLQRCAVPADHDQFRKCLDDLMEMSRYMLPNPVDKPN